MNKAIYFDMDGTIADLYGVENWLDSLQKEHTKPYRIAKPLIDMRSLARELNRLQQEGYKVGIISWLSKCGSTTYGVRVAEAKRKWLKRHLSSVKFDSIHIVEYGTPKHTIGSGILFDDEEANRKMWGKGAYDIHNIIDILRAIK